MNCTWCPWQCGVQRQLGHSLGICKAGEAPKVARAALHQWEEPCISGKLGSGTVFFTHCNLRCVFCQNYEISHEGRGVPVTPAEMAQIFLNLQYQGAHNVNLVSASHYVPQVAVALRLAREQGLHIPTVWNSGGYDSVDALRLLEGLIDIYLPDLKYGDDGIAYRLSGAKSYWSTATKAIKEMVRQVGPLVLDESGIAEKGVIVRHLVLPGLLDSTKDVLDWIKMTLPRGIFVSVMAQYFPTPSVKDRADTLPGELGRRLTEQEYDEVVSYLDIIGLDDGWVQELESASEEYVPSFDFTGVEGHS